MAKKKKSGGTPESYKVDFSGVESGGRPRYPEGDYIATIKAIVPGTIGDDDKPILTVTFEITEPEKFAGREIKERYFITPKALWRLKGLLESINVAVPSKVVNLPLGKMIGKEVGITLTDDEYNNRKYSQVSDTMDAEVVRSGGVDDEDEDILEDEELEDEDEDEEDEDEEEEADLDEMDRDELKAHIKANKLDVKVTKKMKDPQIRKAIRAAEEGDEDDDEMEEVDLEGL